MHHAPYHVITTSNPMALPNRLIVLNTHKIFSLSSQFTVKIGSGYNQFRIFRETACSVFYNGKSLRKYIIQCFFIFFQHFFFQFVYLREDALTIFQFCSFDSTFQFFYLLLFLSSRIRNVLL